jgi:hypothetical protein
VVSEGKTLLSEADLTTIEWNNKGKPLLRPTHSLEKVGMDIGYGHTDSPGGFKYSLLIVNYKTRNTYIYAYSKVSPVPISIMP